MKLTMAMAILASSGVLTSPTFTATQFDVVCNGTFTQNGGKAEPYSIRYSLDLDAKRSCVTAQCNMPGPIFAITPSEIVLTNQRNSNDPGWPVALDFSRIERKTGRYSATFKITAPKRTELKVTATCAPLPFTPFPAKT